MSVIMVRYMASLELVRVQGAIRRVQFSQGVLKNEEMRLRKREAELQGIMKAAGGRSCE